MYRTDVRQQTNDKPATGSCVGCTMHKALTKVNTYPVFRLVGRISIRGLRSDQRSGRHKLHLQASHAGHAIASKRQWNETTI